MPAGAVNDTQPTHEQPAPKRLRQHTDIDKHKQAQLPFAQPHITDHPPDSIHTAEQLDADVVQYLQPQQWLDAQIIGKSVGPAVFDAISLCIFARQW